MVRILGQPLAVLFATVVVACSGGSAAPGDDSDGGDANGAPDSAPFADCPPSAPTGTIPAAVDTVLMAKCQTCHSKPPRMGAPFPLLNYADVHAPFVGTIPIYQKMHELIQASGAPHMPFGNAPQLTPREFATLDGWLLSCAPSGN